MSEVYAGDKPNATLVLEAVAADLAMESLKCSIVLVYVTKRMLDAMDAVRCEPDLNPSLNGYL